MPDVSHRMQEKLVILEDRVSLLEAVLPHQVINAIDESTASKSYHAARCG